MAPLNMALKSHEELGEHPLAKLLESYLADARKALEATIALVRNRRTTRGTRRSLARAPRWSGGRWWTTR